MPGLTALKVSLLKLPHEKELLAAHVPRLIRVNALPYLTVLIVPTLHEMRMEAIFDITDLLTYLLTCLLTYLLTHLPQQAATMRMLAEAFQPALQQC